MFSQNSLRSICSHYMLLWQWGTDVLRNGSNLVKKKKKKHSFRVILLLVEYMISVPFGFQLLFQFAVHFQHCK